MAASPQPTPRKAIGKARRNVLSVLVLLLLPLTLTLTPTGAAKSLSLVYFGIAVGFILQRSKFCLSSAVRDLVLFGDGEIASATLLLLFLSTLGFAGLQAWTGRGAQLGSVAAVGVLTAVGGLLFGVGMVLAGGCISGALWRLGEGHLTHLWTLLGVSAGSLVGFLWARTGWLWPQRSRYLPDLMGLPMALAAALTVLAAAGWWLWRRERETWAGEATEGAPQPRGWARLTGPWRPWFAAVLMAILSVGFLALRGRPWGVLLPFLRWPELLGLSPRQAVSMGAPLAVLSGVLLNTGLILGATVSALHLHEFRWRRPRSTRQRGFALGGGVLMGLGATLGGGCTWGAMVAGISSQSLHGWVFALFLLPGAWLGGFWLRRFLI